MYEINIREEELKNKVAQDYFWIYDNMQIIGNIDFCVSMQKNKLILLKHILEINLSKHIKREMLLF